LPEIGPNDGLGEGEGDGDGDGEGAIGEGGFGETAIGDASSGEGEGESAAGEGESATGEGLGEMVAVAAGTRPQPALSRRAATAMPARRCIPLSSCCPTSPASFGYELGRVTWTQFWTFEMGI
jgi:hypothetical protein